MERLVKAGLVKKDWNAGPNKGMITPQPGRHRRPRRATPRQIQDWDDLTRPGVGVLYPDPKTSGGARWNINAIYGAGLFRDRPGRQARPEGGPRPAGEGPGQRRQHGRLGPPEHGHLRARHGRRRRHLRERAAPPAQDERAEVPYVIPPATLLIEGPAAIVDASVERHGNRAVAEAFLAFLRSAEGQRILADYGFRPLDPGSTSRSRPRAPAAPALHHGRPRRLGARSTRRSTTRAGSGTRSSPAKRRRRRDDATRRPARRSRRPTSCSAGPRSRTWA